MSDTAGEAGRVREGGAGSETSLERAERRFAQAKAQLQALRNREATKQRKLDTRRKVILGGALIDLATRDDRAAEMLERLVRNLVREQDRAAFLGWDWRGEGTAAEGDVESGAAFAGSGKAGTHEGPGKTGGRADAGPPAPALELFAAGSDPGGRGADPDLVDPSAVDGSGPIPQREG